MLGSLYSKWRACSNYNSNSASNHDISVPANRTSTVIFVSAEHVPSTSSYYGGSRSLVLAFYNNCLQLPKGLEFVDDLDTKPNGWNN